MRRPMPANAVYRYSALDYVFTFGFEKPRLKQAWIQDSPPARQASDHYPVGLEVL